MYAIDERLSVVALKLLDPVSSYMLSLINALNRFDAASRRFIPSLAICRAVVESYGDAGSVFGKAVGVLTLRLKVLATMDDIRYNTPTLTGTLWCNSRTLKCVAKHLTLDGGD